MFELFFHIDIFNFICEIVQGLLEKSIECEHDVFILKMAPQESKWSKIARLPRNNLTICIDLSFYPRNLKVAFILDIL